MLLHRQMWKCTGQKPTCVLARMTAHLQERVLDPYLALHPLKASVTLTSTEAVSISSFIWPPHPVLLASFPDLFSNLYTCPHLHCCCPGSASSVLSDDRTATTSAFLPCKFSLYIASRAVLHLQQKLNYVMALLKIFQCLLIFLRLMSELSIWPWRLYVVWPFPTAPPSSLCFVLL